MRGHQRIDLALLEVRGTATLTLAESQVQEVVLQLVEHADPAEDVRQLQRDWTAPPGEDGCPVHGKAEERTRLALGRPEPVLPADIVAVGEVHFFCLSPGRAACGVRDRREQE